MENKYEDPEMDVVYINGNVRTLTLASTESPDDPNNPAFGELH